MIPICTLLIVETVSIGFSQRVSAANCIVGTPKIELTNIYVASGKSSSDNRGSNFAATITVNATCLPSWEVILADIPLGFTAQATARTTWLHIYDRKGSYTMRSYRAELDDGVLREYHGHVGIVVSAPIGAQENILYPFAMNVKSLNSAFQQNFAHEITIDNTGPAALDVDKLVTCNGKDAYGTYVNTETEVPAADGGSSLSYGWVYRASDMKLITNFALRPPESRDKDRESFAIVPEYYNVPLVIKIFDSVRNASVASNPFTVSPDTVNARFQRWGGCIN